MECKIQYVREKEGPFNIHINNDKNDTKDANAIESDKHFTWLETNFNANTKFIFIEQLINKANVQTETL